jgi:hypothetical protein
MYFLTRFLKVFLVALVLTAVGAFIFYKTVVSGNQLRSDVSQEQFVSTVRTAALVWGGFITLLSLMLALTGMRKTVSIPIHDGNMFLQRVHQAITSLRYRPLSQTENLLVYKPPVIGGLLAEKITVQIGQGSATITAPAGMLKRIRGMIQA